MRILAIGAHPDDVEIFMFGLLAACKARGDEIGWIVATDGSRGGASSGTSITNTRKLEASEAGGLLQVEPVYLGEPDGALIDSQQSREALSRSISAFQPDLLITHPPCDYHPDHRALSAITRAVGAFKVPLAYADAYAGIGFSPNIYVDISMHMDIKRRAILCHRSQKPQRFVELAETMGRFRALQVNGRPDCWAEAYRFDPVHPFGDIRDLLPAAPPVRAQDVVNCE